jgi:hypothetical protein
LRTNLFDRRFHFQRLQERRKVIGVLLRFSSGGVSNVLPDAIFFAHN